MDTADLLASSQVAAVTSRGWVELLPYGKSPSRAGLFHAASFQFAWQSPLLHAAHH